MLRAWRIDTGKGRTLVEVGSYFMYVASFLHSRKLILSILVVPGVLVPHSCEYLTYQPKVLLHIPLLHGPLYFCQNPGTHVFVKDLEEGDGIVDYLEIR